MEALMRKDSKWVVYMEVFLFFRVCSLMDEVSMEIKFG